MKSVSFFRLALISFAAALVLSFASCSDASGPSYGSGVVSFTMDKALVKKAFEISKEISKDEPNEPIEERGRAIRFEISLNGEYSATQAKNVNFALQTEDPTGGDIVENKFNSFTVEFADVPVGKMIYAKIRAYEIGNSDFRDGERHILLVGKSNTIQVSSGVNPLSVAAYNYNVSIPYVITIDFEDGNLPDFTTNENCVYAIDPSSKFAKALKAAKDDVERYEICNRFTEDYWDAYLGNISLYVGVNCERDVERNRLVVTDNFSLPVSEDEPGSKCASALFILICQNVKYDDGKYSYKTKYYGMASSAVSPVKKQENTAEFSAKSLNMLDTPYALYNYNDYYLTDNPEQMQASPTFEETKGSSCFDADGNFYVLNEIDGDFVVQSDNSSFATSGKYPCPMGADSTYWNSYCAITSDMASNTLYGYAEMESNRYFVKLCSLPDGSSDVAAYQLEWNCDVWEGERGIHNKSDAFAVGGGFAYFFATSEFDGSVDGCWIFRGEIPESGNTMTLTPFKNIGEIIDGYDVGYGNGYVSAAMVLDGALYAIYFEDNIHQWIPEDGVDPQEEYEGPNQYSRGAVIKYDPSKNEFKALGWCGDKKENTDISKMYFTIPGWCAQDAPFLFKDESGVNVYMVDGSKDPYVGADYPLNNWFPGIRAPYTSDGSGPKSKFARPGRFIAIKPKQLVISDDGIAFYTDKNGGLSYKNVNRVVYIDLQQFSIESANAVSVEFSGDEHDTKYGYSTLIEGEASYFIVPVGYSFYDPVTFYFKTSDTGVIENVSDTLKKSINIAIRNGDAD